MEPANPPCPCCFDQDVGPRADALASYAGRVTDRPRYPPPPALNPHRKRRVDRLRLAGKCVFAACAGLAIVVYRIGVANHEPTVFELMPATAKVIERQRGILYGRAGAALMNWFDALQEPIGRAWLVVAAGFIAAAVFYQAAHRIEVEEG